MMGNWLIGEVEKIEKKTGYSTSFLMAHVISLLDDGAPLDVALDYVDTVSVERDW